MSKDIAEGVLLPTDRTYARLEPSELDQLAFELERALRDIRGVQPPLDDIPALQQRNRRITRLTQGLNMLRAHRSRRRPRAAGPPGQGQGPGAG